MHIRGRGATIMIRAVIVDDEPFARQYLRSLLEDGSGRVEIVGDAGDGAAGLKICRELEIDVVFLDIEMPGPDGLSIAERLLKLARPPLVVFVTGYAGHAVDAFRVEAVDYIVKPLDPEQLAETVRRLERRLAESKPMPSATATVAECERLTIRDRDGVVRLVARQEIVAVVRFRRRTWIHTMTDAYSELDALGAVGRRLGGDPFLQVSRDAIVNLDAIREVRRVGDRLCEVLLRDAKGTRIEASRTGSKILTDKLKLRRNPAGDAPD